MGHQMFDIDDLGRQLGREMRHQIALDRAENYGYWLAVKHMVFVVSVGLATYVMWHIPV